MKNILFVAIVVLLAACTEKIYYENDNSDNGENKKQDEIIKYDLPKISFNPKSLEFSKVGETKQVLVEWEGTRGGDIMIENCWVYPVEGFIISPTTWNSKRESITIQYVGISGPHRLASADLPFFCDFYGLSVNGELTEKGGQQGTLRITIRN